MMNIRDCAAPVKRRRRTTTVRMDSVTDGRLAPTHVRVLVLSIAEFGRRCGRRGSAEFAAACGLSPRRAREVVADLRDYGYIAEEEERRGVAPARRLIVGDRYVRVPLTLALGMDATSLRLWLWLRAPLRPDRRQRAARAIPQSLGSMAAALGLCRRTAQRALARLAAAGWVTVTRVFRGGKERWMSIRLRLGGRRPKSPLGGDQSHTGFGSGTSTGPEAKAKGRAALMGVVGDLFADEAPRAGVVADPPGTQRWTWEEVAAERERLRHG